jgi:hypothetical protein
MLKGTNSFCPYDGGGLLPRNTKKAVFEMWLVLISAEPPAILMEVLSG